MTVSETTNKKSRIAVAIKNGARRLCGKRSVARIEAGSAQDIGARVYQEDAFAFSDLTNSAFCEHGGVLAIAADGVGGLAYGSEVSQLSVLRFVSAYHEKKAEESICDALHRALHSANAAAYEFACSHGDGVEVGTTLSAAVVHRAMIYHISVGDTRIYRASQKEVRQLSTDHNFGEVLDEMAERNELSSEEALQDPQRNHLTSFLGAKNIFAIDYGEEPNELTPGESIIICTDGLYGAVSEEDFCALYSPQPRTLCANLVKNALDSSIPEQDNITVVALTRPVLRALLL